MARGSPVESAIKQRVEELLRAGQPNKAIVEATGVSTWTIKEVAKNAGIYRGAKGVLVSKTEFEQTTAKRLATKGMQPKPNGAETASTSSPGPIESNKYRLLEKIAKHGPFATVGDLTSATHDWPEVRLGGHEVEHIVRNLQREGKVAYREAANSAHGKTLRRIEATVVGRNFVRTLVSPAPKQNERAPERVDRSGPVERITPHGQLTQQPPAVVRLPAPARTLPLEPVEAAPPAPPEPTAPEPPVPPPTPEPVPAPAWSALWPELAALRAKVAEKAGTEKKAERYLEAAALLEEIDAAEARRLSGIASDLVVTFQLSRLEAEYLAFAERCEES